MSSNSDHFRNNPLRAMHKIKQLVDHERRLSHGQAQPTGWPGGVRFRAAPSSLASFLVLFLFSLRPNARWQILRADEVLPVDWCNKTSHGRQLACLKSRS